MYTLYIYIYIYIYLVISGRNMLAYDYTYIYIYIHISCTFNGNCDFIYPVVKGGGYPYSLFRTRSQLELQSELTKHNMIVVGIQWDIAGYIDQRTIGR